MKKLLVMLLALIMCFGMAACGQKDSPSDALKADMENAKSGAEDLMGDLDDSLGEEAGQAFIDKMLDFDYKLGEESVAGDTATVETTITTYPFGDIFSQVLTDYITEAFSNLDMTEEEGQQLMASLMTEALDKAEKSYETTVTVNLAKEDGQWVVQEDDALANALTGGIYDMANSYSSLADM